MDVRESRIDEIYTALRKFCNAHRHELDYCNLDSEDFQQDVVLNIFHRKGLDNYCENKTYAGFEAVIYNIAKRQLIDVKRARYAKSRTYEGRPVAFTSTEQEIPGTDGLTIGQLLEADGDISLAFIEMLNAVPETQISSNYNLTWRELFQMSVKHDTDEIADMIGISVSRTAQLQKQLARDYATLN